MSDNNWQHHKCEYTGEQPKLSVIIPYVLEFPMDALVSVLKNTAFCKFEVFVIASMCDGMPEIPQIENKMAKLTDIYITITKEQIPFVDAVNMAAGHAKGNFIGILPGDMEAAEKWNHPQMLILCKYPNWGFTCGASLEYNYPPGHPNHPIKWRHLLHTCGAIFTSESWKKVGGFDPIFRDGKGFEDDDLYMKYIANGYRPRPLMYHTVSERYRTINQFKKIYGAKGEMELLIKNQNIFIEKWGVHGTGMFREAYVPIQITDVNDIVKSMVYSLGKRIIDIGCSSAQRFRYDAVNFDIDLYNVPNFIRGNAEALPFDNNDFDVSVVGELLEHVENPKAILKEAMRVAKWVVCTVPNESEYDVERWMHPYNEEQKKVYVEKWIRDSGVKEITDTEHLFHRHRFTRESLEKLVNDCKPLEYTILDVEVPYYIGWIIKIKSKEE